MLTQKPFSVSVIIPVYNGALYLGEAIESVLNQSVQPDEVTVVDDGSTDRTAEIAKSYPVQYYLRPHQGAGAARNFGVAQSSGQLLAFIDADDLWLPNKLAAQIEVLENLVEIEVVFGQVEQFGSITYGEQIRPARFVGETLRAPYIGTMLIRREAFLKVGWFDLRWSVAEFVEWYSRAQESNLRMFFSNETFLRRRVHGMNLTLRKKEVAEIEYLQVIREKLERNKLHRAKEN